VAGDGNRPQSRVGQRRSPDSARRKGILVWRSRVEAVQIPFTRAKDDPKKQFTTWRSISANLGRGRHAEIFTIKGYNQKKTGKVRRFPLTAHSSGNRHAQNHGVFTDVTVDRVQLCWIDFLVPEDQSQLPILSGIEVTRKEQQCKKIQA